MARWLQPLLAPGTLSAMSHSQASTPVCGVITAASTQATASHEDPPCLRQAVALACVCIASAFGVFWYAYVAQWFGITGRATYADPDIFLGAVSVETTVVPAVLAVLSGLVIYAVARPLLPSRTLWLAFATATTLLTFAAALIGWTPAWQAICFLVGVMMVCEVGGWLSVRFGGQSHFTLSELRLYASPLLLSVMGSVTAATVFYSPVLQGYAMFHLVPLFSLRDQYGWAWPLYSALTTYIAPMGVGVALVAGLRLTTRKLIPLDIFAITLSLFVVTLTYANAQRWFMRGDSWPHVFVSTAILAIASLYIFNRRNHEFKSL